MKLSKRITQGDGWIRENRINLIIRTRHSVCLRIHLHILAQLRIVDLASDCVWQATWQAAIARYKTRKQGGFLTSADLTARIIGRRSAPRRDSTTFPTKVDSYFGHVYNIFYFRLAARNSRLRSRHLSQPYATYNDDDKRVSEDR